MVANEALAKPLVSHHEAQGSFERVYRGLIRALYENTLVPGQRLVEPDLMRQFGASRGTIREALNRLSAAGIVTLVRHRGATIRMLTRQETNQLLDVVRILFGLAAYRAAEGIDMQDNSAEMVTANDAIAPFRFRNDLLGFVAAREHYYRTVVRLSGNVELARLFPDTQVHIMRLQLRAFDRAADSMHFDDYGEVTAAILSGNPEAAQDAAYRHVLHTVNSVAAVPDRAFRAEA